VCVCVVKFIPFPSNYKDNDTYFQQHYSCTLTIHNTVVHNIK